MTAWRKSTFSGSNSNCVEVGFVWRKSSYSGSNSECVEVGRAPERAAVRDSKNVDGPVLSFAADVFGAFVRGL